MTIGAINYGEKACIASLEFKPQKWLFRLVRQISGVNSPSIPYIKEIQNWLNNKLWVFNVTGTAKAKRILEVFRYARKRYNIQLFVIDNLSKLDIGLEDYDGQKAFVDQLTDFAQVYDSHVILVAHTRKGQDDSKPGGKFDVKGSGSIVDLADTLLVWWRNRPKEEQLRKTNGDTSEEDLKKIQEKPDAVIRCEKQRNGDFEPVIGLWFDTESHQFLETKYSNAIQYVEYTGGRA